MYRCVTGVRYASAMDELARATSLIWRQRVKLNQASAGHLGMRRMSEGSREGSTYHWLKLPADTDGEALLASQVGYESLVLPPQVAVHECDGNRVDALTLELVELFRDDVAIWPAEHLNGLPCRRLGCDGVIIGRNIYLGRN